MLELWAAILILAVLLFVLTVVVRVEIGDLKQSLSLAEIDIRRNGATRCSFCLRNDLFEDSRKLRELVANWKGEVKND